MPVRVSNAIAALVCLTAAAGSAAQALSNIYAFDNPAMAATLSPYASEAYERLAILSLRPEADGLSLDTRDASVPALEAMRRGPLASEAAAILSMERPSQADRHSSIAAVAQLSRRGRILNFAVLQDAILLDDAQRSISALNHAFLVYPSFISRFLPILHTFLGDSSTIVYFREILESDPVWGDAFFAASGIPSEALANMAQLRIALDDRVILAEETDRLLVARLATAGLWTESFTLHDRLTGEYPVEGGLLINWQSDYPPFDWNFADERRFYARPDAAELSLRIRIDPGQGGPLASRILRVPTNARALALSHSLEPVSGLPNLNLSVNCVEQQADVAIAEFRPGRVEISLDGHSCDWIVVAIAGRVWSGGTEILGEIERLEFER